MKQEQARGNKPARRFLPVLLIVLLPILFLQCSDPLTEPVAQAPEAKLSLSKVQVSNPYFEYPNFISVPSSNWPQDPWTGDLVVYAHGYYAFNEVWHPLNDKVDDTPIAGIVNKLGFAYASTAYSTTGLAVEGGVKDLTDLVDLFVNLNSPASGPRVLPRHIYLVGPSEGGLITTLALEKTNGIFNGGLAMCGPIGDFRKQMDYFGDFHVVFNYFFPSTGLGFSLGSPSLVPEEAIAQWNNNYKGKVETAAAASPWLTGQLLSVTKAPYDLLNPSTSRVTTVVDILWYNVFATNDANTKLSGCPYGNRGRWYWGSLNDFKLNVGVERFTSSQTALNRINKFYQTSGRLNSQLVTLHTLGDPIIPYWHATLYGHKVFSTGSGWRYAHIPILRYGHCKFNVAEVLVGFAVLVLKVTGQDLVASEKAFPSMESQLEFLRLSRQHGANPRIAVSVSASQ